MGPTRCGAAFSPCLTERTGNLTAGLMMKGMVADQPVRGCHQRNDVVPEYPSTDGSSRERRSTNGQRDGRGQPSTL
jgi:hypothetical protein